MSDDPDSNTPPKRSWLEKLSQAFSGEPESLDDLREILDSAAKHGLIDTDTLKRLQGALAVSEMTVSDVMVPRGQMVSLSATDSFLDLMRQVVESGHSRFPVHGEDKDEIVGILLAKDLLRGVVVDKRDDRGVVLIPELAIDVKMRQMGDYSLGQELEVTLSQIQLTELDLSCRIV